MSFLKSPYTEEQARAQAKSLQEKALAVVSGASGECPHQKEWIEVSCKTNGSADNKLGLQTTVTVTCSHCDSKAVEEFDTPICSKCSEYTSGNTIVKMLTTGPVRSGRDRDYDVKYPCICPICEEKKDYTLRSSYD